jgi:type VII secretion integral membrane protein EccD
VFDSLCRLTVQSGEYDGSLAVDLALPRNAGIGQLMPSIVDLVHRDTTRESARRWRLSRIAGGPLDESMTLNGNDVRDGDLLLLTAVEPPAPRWAPHDACHTVARPDNGGRPPVLRIIAVIVWLFGAGIGASALAWSGMITRAAGHVVTGALLAAGAAVGAVIARRAQQDSLPSVALSVVAVVYTAVVGFLSVPAGPSAANGLLAAAAGFSMAILLLRLTGCGTVCLTAVASSTALAAATAAGCVAWTLPAEAAGAALAILSLGVIGLAARLSITIAGLTPAFPTAEDGQASVDVGEAQAALAHRTLTGLVAGTSGSAALGSVLVACGELDDGDSWLSAAVFTAVIGLVLLLRARTHSDMPRRIALTAGGMISVAAGFAVTIVSAPAQAHWMTVLAAATGTSALGWLFGLTVSPVVRRAIELLEYLALAAVMPLACWVVGLYGLVRGLSLT